MILENNMQASCCSIKSILLKPWLDLGLQSEGGGSKSCMTNTVREIYVLKLNGEKNDKASVWSNNCMPLM